MTPAPAMGSLFYQAMSIATTKSLVFINGDIMLPPVMGDLMMSVNNATDRFLLLSHRYCRTFCASTSYSTDGAECSTDGG